MKLKVLALLLFIPIYSEARPYSDLILLPPAKQKGVRILRNKNITYTNEQPEERGGTGLVKTLYAVKGRSRPDRSGKVLSQINGASVVTPFRLSKDKKWIAVVVRSSGVRVWIPKSSVPKLDKNLRLSKQGDAEKIED
jgi:hypothetical protein